MDKRTGRVTRTQVAKAAGVSTAVVSYVVNNGPRPVAKDTRERVLKAIDQLGYRPNAFARAVKLGTSSTFGVLVPDVTQPFHSWVVQELDQLLAQRGFSLLLANVHEVEQMEKAALSDMISRGVDHIVVLMSSIPDSFWLKARIPIPVAMMDRQSSLKGFLTVGSDFRAAGQLSTRHLIHHGRTRIVPIFGHFIREEPNSRFAGYLEEIEAAGLAPVDPLICSWGMEGGYVAGQEFIYKGGPAFADAAFCFSDAIAIGFMRAMHEAHVRVPEDVAVIGFDGIDLARFAQPMLTTVAQPVSAMVDFLVSTMIDGFDADTNELHTFPVTLQPGHSCGC